LNERVRYSLLEIDDRDDGGCKSDKFERDERLLRDGLLHETDPSLRTRYKFYLAQTYHSMRKFPQSISWYRERIKDSGFFEEVYHSYFQIGDCYAKMGDRERAVGSFLEAMIICPQRAEPYYEIAKLYREIPDAKGARNAVTFAEAGMKIPFPKNLSLFLNYNVYNYLLKYEMSISGYYIPEYFKLGKKCCFELLEDSQVPEWVKTNVKNNLKYYLDKENVEKISFQPKDAKQK
jgi:tetratricopeptide (TPR) repeat protein